MCATEPKYLHCMFASCCFAKFFAGMFCLEFRCCKKRACVGVGVGVCVIVAQFVHNLHCDK